MVLFSSALYIKEQITKYCMYKSVNICHNQCIFQEKIHIFWSTWTVKKKELAFIVIPWYGSYSVSCLRFKISFVTQDSGVFCFSFRWAGSCAEANFHKMDQLSSSKGEPSHVWDFWTNIHPFMCERKKAPEGCYSHFSPQFRINLSQDRWHQSRSNMNIHFNLLFKLLCLILPGYGQSADRIYL